MLWRTTQSVNVDKAAIKLSNEFLPRSKRIIAATRYEEKPRGHDPRLASRLVEAEVRKGKEKEKARASTRRSIYVTRL